MNIFYLHMNVKQCVKWYVDRHVVKMIIETAQLLCSAIWLSGKEAPYKLTHKNHPCAIWTRANRENWCWLKQLGLALCEEYFYRYNKIHKTESIIKNLECPNLKNESFKEPPQAMPNEYKIENDSIQAYRLLYTIGKKHLHAWKKREIPEFIKEINENFEKLDVFQIRFEKQIKF